jgi:Pyruvate/2-oxoacid:ferredoxin oxidoreductase gamma subunit
MTPSETLVAPQELEEEEEKFRKLAEEARKKYYEPYKKTARYLKFTDKLINALNIIADNNRDKIPDWLPIVQQNALASKILAEIIQNTGKDLQTLVNQIIKKQQTK